jgi:tol-pal system protein YbgF
MALPLAAGLSFAQNRQQVEMQRDIAILQVEVRELKSQQGERFAVLEELIKQGLETTSRLNQAIAVIERSVSQQGDSVIKPVTSMSTKMDTMTSQVSALRDVVEALNTRMGRMQQQMEDIQNHLTTIPPPSTEGGPAAGTTSTGSAETLYNSALTDFHRGNYDLAQAQFGEYLRLYPQSGRAAEAQYYVGDIFYQKRDYPAAISNYDMVLERYPEGTKSPDAQYKKGLALLMLNKLPEAAAEFRSVVEKYPSSNIAPNAKAQLDELQSADQSKPSPTRRSSR